MSKILSAAIAVVVILNAVVSMSLAAQANLKMRYQGFLTDSATGAPVNAVKGFKFRILNAPNGTWQWESACTDISVSNGVLRAVLGETTGPGWEPDIWDRIKWNSIDAHVEVLMGDPSTCANSVTMTPPERLLASAYTMNQPIITAPVQSVAPGHSYFMPGLQGHNPAFGNFGIGTSDPAALVDIVDRWSSQSGIDFRPTVSILAAVPKFFLKNKGGVVFSIEAPENNLHAHVGVKGASQGLHLGADGGFPHLMIKNSGNVGIGTADPEQKLSVDGTIHSIRDGFKFPDNSLQRTASLFKHGSSGYGLYAPIFDGETNMIVFGSKQLVLGGQNFQYDLMVQRGNINVTNGNVYAGSVSANVVDAHSYLLHGQPFGGNTPESDPTVPAAAKSLNQAVNTNSAPTFGGITVNGTGSGIRLVSDSVRDTDPLNFIDFNRQYGGSMRLRYKAGPLGGDGSLWISNIEGGTDIFGVDYSGRTKIKYGLELSGGLSIGNNYGINFSPANEFNTHNAIWATAPNANIPNRLTLQGINGVRIVNNAYQNTLTVTDAGDAAITTQGKGLILRATDGANCFRITVNNGGGLSTASVPCP